MAAGQDESWLPARDALALIEPAFSDLSFAKEAILKRAAAGLMRARCRLKRTIKNDGMRTVTKEENCAVNTGFWDRLSPSEQGHRADWDAGDFVAKIFHDISGSTEIQVFTVEFREADLRAIPGVPKAPSLAVFPVGVLQSLAGEVAPSFDPFAEAVPGAPLSELLRYLQQPAQDRGYTEEQLAELTKRMSRRRGEGPYELPPQPVSVTKPSERRAPARRRDGIRKAAPVIPHVPDDKLTAWYEKYYAEHPDDVYRIVRPKADKRFQPKFKVGRNQLYDIMRSVQGKLKVGKR